MSDVDRSVTLNMLRSLEVYLDSKVSTLVRRELERAASSEIGSSVTTIPIRWVYFIQGESGGLVKIGVANDPEKRRVELQRTSPVPLKILARERGGTARERDLHLQFADLRAHGEWFSPAPRLLDYISSLKTFSAAERESA